MNAVYRHLPATLIASFIKRLSRLSLSAPPAAVVAIIPLVYNLLKRHPTCMVLIHRDIDAENLGAHTCNDLGTYCLSVQNL